MFYYDAPKSNPAELLADELYCWGLRDCWITLENRVMWSIMKMHEAGLGFNKRSKHGRSAKLSCQVKRALFREAITGLRII